MRNITLFASLCLCACWSAGSGSAPRSEGDLSGASRGRSPNGGAGEKAAGAAGATGSTDGTAVHVPPDAGAPDSVASADALPATPTGGAGGAPASSTLPPDAGLPPDSTPADAYHPLPPDASRDSLLPDSGHGPRLVIGPAGPLDLGAVKVGEKGRAVTVQVTNLGDQPSEPVTLSSSSREVDMDETAAEKLGHGCTRQTIPPSGYCSVALAYLPMNPRDLAAVVYATAGTLSASVQVVGHVLGADGGR